MNHSTRPDITGGGPARLPRGRGRADDASLLTCREATVDHSSLVALFRRIVLAGSPLLGGGFIVGCGSNGCPAPGTTHSVALSQPGAGSADASIDDLIARCQAS